jgi:hypothetical protein
VSDKFIRPNICVIALDETQYWELPVEYKPYLKGVESVYWFNRNLAVHLAEFTGSYELHFIEIRPVFSEEFSDARYDEKQTFDLVAEDGKVRKLPADWIMDEIDNFLISNNDNEPVDYTHIYQIEKLITDWQEAKTPWVFHEYGDLHSEMSDEEYQTYLDGPDFDRDLEDYFAQGYDI